jgi:glycosyltransferase involved in cell wall biosynthesis
MHWVFVIYNAGMSGSVMSTTRRQAEYLAEQGDDVTVLSNEAPAGWRGIRYVHAPAVEGRTWRTLDRVAEAYSSRLPAALRRFSLRTVIAQWRFAYSAAKRVAELAKTEPVDGCICCQHFCANGLAGPGLPPYVLVAHGDIFEHPRAAFSLAMRRLYRRSAMHSYRTARHVVAVSQALRARAIRCGAAPERVSVIPNGIAAEEIGGDDAQPAERRAEFELLYVGRLSAEKAVDVAIRALALIKLPSMRLRIIGDGPTRGALEKLTAKLGLNDSIEFLGAQPRHSLGGYYAAADVVLLPSLSEAQGLAVLEAQICGTPVIASRVGGIPDMIEDGRNGLLVPPSDVDALSAAVRTLWSHAELRTSMAAGALESVKDFAWHSLLEAFDVILRAALDQGKPESSAVGIERP